MHSQSSSHEITAQIRSWASDASAEHRFLFVDGPAASGKTEVLREVAAAVPEASLLDATGLSTEEVVDGLMQTLGVPYGDYRDIGDLVDNIRERRLSRLVLVTNVQWAGRTRSTTEASRVGDLLARTIGSPYQKTGVRLVLEVDSGIHPLSSWIRSVVTLPPRPDVVRPGTRSLPVGHRTALRALALAEPRSLRLEEWQLLCSALGSRWELPELQVIADESEYVSVDAHGEFPVALAHESDAYALRS